MQHDQIVVVDIEATCWEGEPPSGETNEIIEIGVCLLNPETLEITQPAGIFVKPTMSKVSPFCTQLTTITQAMLDVEGTTFADALAALQSTYGSANRLWGSWGAYDRKMFELQCRMVDVEYPFSSKHLNIKQLQGKLDNHKKAVGMPAALEMYGLTMKGTYHRGVDDAINIARILAAMLQKHGTGVLAKYW